MEYTVKKQEGNQLITLEKTPGYSYDFHRQRLLIECIMSSMCVMHEKSCLDEVAPFDEALETGTDWDLWIRLSKKHPFIHVPIITAQTYSSK